LTVIIAGFVAGYAVLDEAETNVGNKKTHALSDMCRRPHIEFYFGFPKTARGLLICRGVHDTMMTRIF
jgi:hypothetical protein